MLRAIANFSSSKRKKLIHCSETEIDWGFQHFGASSHTSDVAQRVSKTVQNS